MLISESLDLHGRQFMQYLGSVKALSLIILLSFCSSVIAIESNAVIVPTEQVEQYSDEYTFIVAKPEKLAIKLYRKALYYYFQDQPELALQQLAYNKARLGMVDDNALLFEAGLQVSLGFYHQAEKNLTALTKTLSQAAEHSKQQKVIAETNAEQGAGQRFEYFASQDLLSVALLQLAEQQINQKQSVNAQLTLAKITQLPKGYYQQYHILNQLAYWPKSPKLALENILPSADEAAKDPQTEAYILLNTALMHIEQNEFDTAEQELMALKLMNWELPKQTFWQQLFSIADFFANSSDNLTLHDKNDHEQQSLKDYASLLLAQLYVEQEKFSSAYKELANFPQNSPFTEQALFLFAYASLQTQHYAESEAIFNVLSSQYPASHLSWQADVLLARQYLIQRDLDTALNQYLALEGKYLAQLASLSTFEQQLTTTPELMISSFVSTENKNVDDSIWWEKARTSVMLTAQFDQANALKYVSKKMTLQQKKVQWLDYAITLNESRQVDITAQRRVTNYQVMIAQLQIKRDQLAQQLNEAARDNNVQTFATKQQQQWLLRIANSQKTIASIASIEQYQKRVIKYKERLQRVAGVLNWQLHQAMPERLWQHRQQLQQLDEALSQIQQQMKQVDAIEQTSGLTFSTADNLSENRVNSLAFNKILQSKAGLNLPQLKARHEKIAQSSATLSDTLATLTHLTDERIKKALLVFISEQRQQLNYYLHHSRRAMAKILEELKKVDVYEVIEDNGVEN